MQVVVGVVVWNQHQVWSIESTRFHRPNLVSCEVINIKRTPPISIYLPPYTLEHLLYLVEDPIRLWDQEPILLGDFNADIQSKNTHSQQVSELLMEFGLVDLHHHLVSTGVSGTCNVVSDATRHIFVDKM